MLMDRREFLRASVAGTAGVLVTEGLAVAGSGRRDPDPWCRWAGS